MAQAAFYERMLEAQHEKQAARNRGQSIGDYRGTVKPRRLEDPPTDWLELAFAEIARDLAFRQREEANQLVWIIAFNNDATMAEIPF